MFCSNCGKPNADNSKFCSYCGNQLVINYMIPVNEDIQRAVTNRTDQIDDYSQNEESGLSGEYNQWTEYEQSVDYYKNTNCEYNADYYPAGGVQNSECSSQQWEQSDTYNQMKEGNHYLGNEGLNKGTQISTTSTTSISAKKPISKNALIGIIVGASMLVIVSCILCAWFYNSWKTINLNKFLVIEANGYEGYGRADAYIDWIKIEEKYGKRLKLTRAAKKELGSAYKTTSPMVFIKRAVTVKLVQSENLSNGDKIEFVWNVDEDYIKKYVKGKVKFKDKDYNVNGLAELETFDAFDGLEVTFEGISPNGQASINYTGNMMDTYEFYCDKFSGLKNGDTIVVSVPSDNMAFYADRFGMIPESTEKEYVVSGLREYVSDYSDIPDNFISDLKKESEDIITARAAGFSNRALNNLEYIGYVFSVLKDTADSDAYNKLYIIFKGNLSNDEGDISSTSVYFPVLFTNIIKADEFEYQANNGIIGLIVYSEWGSTILGYSDPINCYKDLIDGSRDKYTSQSGDGFEIYSEFENIDELSDIPASFKDYLTKDALDKVESYIATYSKNAIVGDVKLKGDCLLIAKSQGTDFKYNNMYVVVYSMNLSSTDDAYEARTIFYPVVYDGLMVLPNNECIVSYDEGIKGKTSLSYRYYTAGYDDGKRMYSSMITVYRDEYVYDVSEGLKKYGE